ncbi:MAG: hypothetical protein P9L97_12735 [Candidatus Tenebribacter davisii]|nr:hypothetical protein [Candidatus Tenebribacter davisii]
MKKFLILSILVLFLGSLMALESGPSETVGFVKVNAPANVYTTFSLPLEVDGMMASVVFSDGTGAPYITGGANPVFSDQIQEVGGASAWYNSNTSLWVGDFAVDVTKAYYAVIRAAHPAADIYVCGLVDNTTIVNYDPILPNVYTTVGFREAGSTKMVSDLGLVTAGFQGGANPVFSDQIQEVGGASAWYNSNTSLWVGDFAITPGKAYYLIIRNGHSGLAAYSYPATGADDFYVPFKQQKSQIRKTFDNKTKNVNNTRKTQK